MNVAIFEPNKRAVYLKSVNGAEYLLDPQAKKGQEQPKDSTILINPDITAVANVEVKFWKKVNGAIQEMTAQEKQAVLDAELTQRKSQADDFNVGFKEVLTALIKVINIRLPQGQKITKAELVAAIKEEII